MHKILYKQNAFKQKIPLAYRVECVGIYNGKTVYAAKDMLQVGESPTKIYEKCGFNDYTTFFKAYKAYKKKFGHSPKYELVRIDHIRKN